MRFWVRYDDTLGESDLSYIVGSVNKMLKLVNKQSLNSGERPGFAHLDLELLDRNKQSLLSI
jgi:hypothetical protein